MNTTMMKDIPTATRSIPKITIYGPPICPNCKKATDFFDRLGILYTKVDLAEGDTNHRYVKHELGYEAAPVVVIEFEDHNTVHYGGHRMDMLMAIRKLFAKGIAPGAPTYVPDSSDSTDISGDAA